MHKTLIFEGDGNEDGGKGDRETGETGGQSDM